MPDDLITAYVDWGVGQGWQSAIVHRESGNVIAGYNYPSSGTRLVRFKFTSDYGGEIFAEVVVHIEHAIPEGTTPTPTSIPTPTLVPGAPTPTPTPVSEAPASFVSKFGGVGTGDGQFKDPTGITPWAGKIVVADTGNNRLQMFNLNGDFISTSDPGQFNAPTDVDFNTRSEFFVLDTGNKRIKKFWNYPGNALCIFGDTGDGKLENPTNLAVSKKGVSYVFVSDGTWIKKFSRSCNFISKFNVGVQITAIGLDEYEENGQDLYSSGPSHIYVGIFGKVMKYDWDGNWILSWGHSGGPELGNISGIGVIDPNPFDADPVPGVFVSDTDNDRVLKYDVNGNFLTMVGGTSGIGQLSGPTGVAGPSGNVLEQHCYFWVVDTGNNQIQKFCQE